MSTLRQLTLIFDDTTPTKATINLVAIEDVEILPGIVAIEATAVWQTTLSSN